MIREVVTALLILGAVVWGLVNARHRLRPWYVGVAGIGAFISVPVTITLISSARAGQFTGGGGGLAFIIMLLAAVFVAALSVTALATRRDSLTARDALAPLPRSPPQHAALAPALPLPCSLVAAPFRPTPGVSLATRMLAVFPP